MNKQETIQEIKRLLSIYGCFAIGELDDVSTQAPCTTSIGSVVALAEYFTEDNVEINIYQTNSFSSDPIETIDDVYENLTEDILAEVLQLCQQWEAQSIQTEKRISN